MEYSLLRIHCENQPLGILGILKQKVLKFYLHYYIEIYRVKI